MTQEPVQVDDVFDAALRRPAGAERIHYLEEACQGDQDLRRRVERLLQAAADAGSFLESPAQDLSPTLDTTRLEKPGAQIGPYKLLEQIGEGGFGVVYMAEQTQPVRRKVALKIIKPGMDSRQVIARFEAERQALAIMDHPHIAKVLDGGADENGRPYFVMELVRGTPITDYCDENRLAPRQRLELLIPVCQAVQHAHQKGIIHRDLKPSNVLVVMHDTTPMPKVIDFGIAKALGQDLTDKTLFTGFAQMVGTPLYMSPEQAGQSGLDVDTRSDVYTIGVLLYELLTGTTPFSKDRFKQAAYEEIRRIIREEEPPPPSTRLSHSTESLPAISAQRQMEPVKLPKLVKGELDWIVMKCLEKDRSRRYDTASALADDLRRFLNGEPVLAHPPALAYRFRKFARRHRGALAVACLVTVTLLAACAVSAVLAVRATKAERLARARLTSEKRARGEAFRAKRAAEQARDRERMLRTEAQQQKRRAQENFDKARSAVDEYFVQISENELLSAPGMHRLRLDLLMAALNFYSELMRQPADGADLQLEAAEAHYRAALIHRELGDDSSFRTAIAEAVRRYDILQKRSPESLSATLDLARACSAAAEYEKAEALCRQVLKVEPGQEQASKLLADTYNARLLDAGENLTAEQTLELNQKALAIRLQLVQDHPENEQYLFDLSRSTNNIGASFSGQGRLRDALEMYELSLAHRQRAKTLSHTVIWGKQMALTLGNIGYCQAALGMTEKAVESYNRQVSLLRKLAFENPSVPGLRADLYAALMAQARFLNGIGRTAEASRSLRSAREILDNMPQETPGHWIDAAGVYATLASQSGRDSASADEKQDAERFLELAMQALRKLDDAQFVDTARIEHDKLLEPLRTRADFQELAARIRRRAVEEGEVRRLRPIVEKPGGDEGFERPLALALHSLGLSQLGQKRFEEAEKNLEEAVKRRAALMSAGGDLASDPVAAKDRLDWIASRVVLGQIWAEQQRLPEAHRMWQDCMDQLRTLSVLHPNDFQWRLGIAEQERLICGYYAGMGMWPLAAEVARRNLELRRITEGASNDHYFAVTLAVIDAMDELRDYRRMMLPVYREWGAVHTGSLVPYPWLNVLEEESRFDAENTVPMAERILKADPTGWVVSMMALVNYRQGKLPEAVDITERWGSLEMQYASVLVRHAMKDDALAESWWRKANATHCGVIEESLLAPGPFMPVENWWGLAYVEPFRREAQKKLPKLGPPHNPWLHLQYARGYRMLGELDKAEEELAASVSVTPVDASVWRTRGKFFERFGDARRAEHDWSQSVESAPDDPLAWFQRGLARCVAGDLALADADFQQAITLWRRQRESLDQLAAFLLADSEVNAALEWRLKSLQWHAGAAAPRFGLAQGLCDLALQFAADSPSGEQSAAEKLARQLGARAVALAREGLEIDSGPASHWSTLGLSQCIAGQPDEANTALASARERLGQQLDARTAFAQALTCLRLGRIDEASQWRQKGSGWAREHPSADASMQRFEELVSRRLEAALQP